MQGFHEAERELSPKPEYADTDDAEEERMATATDSSQSDEDSRPRDQSETASDVFGDGQSDVVNMTLLIFSVYLKFGQSGIPEKFRHFETVFSCKITKINMCECSLSPRFYCLQSADRDKLP